jgi:hypothetical protein
LAAGRGMPHPPQNLSSGSLANPQAAQGRANAAPQAAQKRRPARFSVWHWGHCIPQSPVSDIGTMLFQYASPLIAACPGSVNRPPKIAPVVASSPFQTPNALYCVLNIGKSHGLFHRRRVPPARAELPQSCSSQAQAQAANVWDCQGEKTGSNVWDGLLRARQRLRQSLWCP